MKVTRISSADASDGHSIKLVLVVDDATPHELTLPPDVALQLVLAVRAGAIHLGVAPDTHPLKAFVLSTCSPAETFGTAPTDHPCIVLRTAEGFEIPILVTPETRRGLKACIDALPPSTHTSKKTH